MSRTLKRVLALTFVVALLLSMSVSAFAAGTVTPVTGTQYVYRTNKTGDSYVNVSLASGTKNFTIYRKNVTVGSNSIGARLVEFSKNYNSYSHTYEYNYSSSDTWTNDKYSHVNCSYNVGLHVQGTGSVPVTYKIGTKTYKTTVKVLNYVNPVYSITLTGVNGGKSFASLTKTALYGEHELALKANTKSAKVVVKPTTGWKISEVRLYDITSGTQRALSNYSKPFSSATLTWGTLYASHDYELDVEFVNTTNGASMYIYYPISNSFAS